jgi:hypothetical protein
MRKIGEQSRPAPRAAALHGSRGHPQDLSYLGDGIAHHVDEDERRTLLRGQHAKRRVDVQSGLDDVRGVD